MKGPMYCEIRKTHCYCHLYGRRCEDYAELEREHLGDADKKTGIYAEPDAAGDTTTCNTK